MSVKEKLRLMAEIERQNAEKWLNYFGREGKESAGVQVLLHERKPRCEANAS